MSAKARWQHIKERQWSETSNVWLGEAAAIANLDAPPATTLENLDGIEAAGRLADYVIHQDIPGIRKTILWDGLFLFQKGDNARHSAERLLGSGLSSWAMFNFYHSAYLYAKSILCLWGVALPQPKGLQLLVDIFPEEAIKRQSTAARKGRSEVVSEFYTKKLQGLDQKDVWDCLFRLLRVAKCDFWPGELTKALAKREGSEVTPPRNHFLYKVPYWVYEDLIEDDERDWTGFDTEELVGEGANDFLMHLCYWVTRLSSLLIEDLATQSPLFLEFVRSTRSAKYSLEPERQILPYIEPTAA